MMDSFISRKRKQTEDKTRGDAKKQTQPRDEHDADADTDTKLAILASLLPGYDHGLLLDALVGANGSIEEAMISLTGSHENAVEATENSAKKLRSIGYQSSLSKFGVLDQRQSSQKRSPLTKRGKTLHLFDPDDVSMHTPCSIVHNFLPADQADALLRELLDEAQTFHRASFRIFENVVQSPHTACFYVESLQEQQRQKTEYLYNGGFLEDVRQITPQMSAVAPRVKVAVNEEITKRIKTRYPDQKKLKYQSTQEWLPNAAFVNCYAGGAESVGYHSDQLTYLGPRAVIGSLSLGVAREFRVRKIVPPDEDEPPRPGGRTQADEQGQIAIHLPHNSLLVMHAEMQEEWKHSIAPAQSIDPHPVAGNKRINVTYRHYREDFHPNLTPRCRCKVATVLRCVQRKKENRGRYMWMCHAGLAPDNDEGCGFFQWAEFDDDGHPPWVKKTAVSVMRDDAEPST